MNKPAAFIYSSFCALFLLAYYIQTQLFLSPDVAFLLYITKIMINGGKYVTDFFETNPPMILYLSSPVCILAKYTNLDTLFIFRLYVLSLIFISFALSYKLLKQIIKPQDKIELYFFAYMILFVLLILPFFAFGQREHFFMIFIMPYLFVTALELEGKAVNKSLALFIGLFAGLGFAIKPFFLAPFALVELYYIIKKRNLFAWFRIEPIAIASVIAIYLLSVHLFQPLYLSIVLPLVMRYYFISAVQPWMETLTNSLVQFSFVGVISYALFYKNDHYRTLNTVLCLALLGTIIAFLIPRTPWYYHILPAVGFAFILTIGYLGQIIQLSTRHRDTIIILFASALFYLVPIVTVKHYFQLYNNAPWRDSSTKLASYIEKFKGNHSVYCFTKNGASDCFPLLFNINGQLGGRFHFFWWYSGLRKLENQQLTNQAKTQLDEDKNYFLNVITEDLNRYRSKWVFVNTRSFKNWEQESKKIASEYISYQNAWKHYHYTTTIDNYRIYTRDKL